MSPLLLDLSLLPLLLLDIIITIAAIIMAHPRVVLGTLPHQAVNPLPPPLPLALAEDTAHTGQDPIVILMVTK